MQRIVAQNPTSILFARLADAYLVAGDVARATETCRRGLRYRPSYATGHLVLGRCHQAAGRSEEARQEFQKVLQLDSDNLAAFLYLGRAERDQGNAVPALDYLTQALQLDPFNTGLADEIDALRRVTGVDLDSTSPQPAQEPAPPEVPAVDPIPADRAGPFPKQRTAAIGPKKTPGGSGETADGVAPFASLTLADLYADQGHPAAAQVVLQRVLSGDPENTVARDRLRQIQERIIRETEA